MTHQKVENSIADPWMMEATGDLRTIDLDEVRRSLGLLIDPDVCHEIRGLPSGRSRLVKGSDLDGAANRVKELEDERVGIYYTLNPVKEVIGDKAAKVADITKRRHLLIDVDPVRPRDVMATDGEKLKAAALVESVRIYLTDLGWPSPLLIDSGNGWHLIYKIDLPNDKLAHEWIAHALKALAKRFDTDDAKVDTKVHNASRISKLPGTWVRKGIATDDRPYRMARLVAVPTALVSVPDELIRDLAGFPDRDDNSTATDTASAPNSAMAAPDPWLMEASSGSGAGNLEAWVAKAIDEECAALAATPEGDRNNKLNECAFRLGQLLHAKTVTRPYLEERLSEAARQCGLSSNEIRATIRSGIEAGIANPRVLPQAPASRNGVVATKNFGGRGKALPPDFEPPPNTKLIVWASSITPKPVEWLWPSRIPLGKLTTFAGRTGLGKTFALCDIAARVSRGDEWPHSGGECAPPGKVLFISAEDDADDTLVPRLIELGADLRQIAFLSPEADEHFTLAALKLLSAVLEQMSGEVRLVAIDPPTSFLGGVDDHRNSELRGLLTPLKWWASRNRVAIVLNTHINKGGSHNVEAVARVMGSVAWVNAVRAAHMFAPDPDDNSKRLFLPLKLNIGAEPKAISYRIVKTETLARIEWTGEVDTSADEAVKSDRGTGGSNGQSRQVNAETWLIARFRERLEWPSNELFEAASAVRLSRNAIFEAKGSLNLPRAKQVMAADGSKAFVWWVPPDWPKLFEDGTHANGQKQCNSGSVQKQPF